MNKITTVCAFTPRVFLGNPYKNAQRILECMEQAHSQGADVAVFPQNALTGDTLGDIARFQTMAEARKSALDLVVKASETIAVGVIFAENDNLLYILNGIIRNVSKNNCGTVDGIFYISTANPAQAMGYHEIEQAVRNTSHSMPVVYVSAGYGESTTDSVPDGVMMIARDGRILAEHTGVYGDSYGLLTRHATCTAQIEPWQGSPSMPEETAVTLDNPTPFLPQADQLCAFARNIFHIQVAGLVRRMEHTGAKCAVVALSGGLDSALALLVAKKTVALLGLPPTALMAITMPCFGTTGRTLNNAQGLMAATGAECRTISIKDSVLQHFADIGHSPDDHSVVFENAQARERTQIGLDLANKHGGIFVGTGDLSELVLGFTTFSGDHLSMYGVNGGLPKTIVRLVTQYMAQEPEFAAEKPFLLDILDTPISPELLPPADDVMSQKTESILGSYDVHDYGIYHLLSGVDIGDIYEGAQQAFAGKYSPEDLQKTLSTLFRRFVTQQFKRSCLPDGPGVFHLSVSPRGGLHMPSDMAADLFVL